LIPQNEPPYAELAARPLRISDGLALREQCKLTIIRLSNFPDNLDKKRCGIYLKGTLALCKSEC